MLQPDQLLHTECEEERESLFLFFDGRSSVTTPIEDCTILYVFMQRLNWLKLIHLRSANHMQCDTENDESAEFSEVPFGRSS